MMEEIEKLLRSREIPFSAKQRKIMCFPHIINIIVQHVIKKMSRSLPPEDDEDDDLDDLDNDGEDIDHTATQSARQAAYARDPIGRCQKIVVSIRSSGQRREKFDTWITTGK